MALKFGFIIMLLSVYFIDKVVSEMSNTDEKSHLEKRSLLNEDDNYRPEYENAFAAPHRIRVLPGYLH